MSQSKEVDRHRMPLELKVIFGDFARDSVRTYYGIGHRGVRHLLELPSEIIKMDLLRWGYSPPYWIRGELRKLMTLQSWTGRVRMESAKFLLTLNASSRIECRYRVMPGGHRLEIRCFEDDHRDPLIYSCHVDCGTTDSHLRNIEVSFVGKNIDLPDRP